MSDDQQNRDSDEAPDSDEEMTVMAHVPDELVPAPASRPEAPRGNLSGQVLTRGNDAARDALPTDDEGDALLDKLFGGDDEAPRTPAPVAAAAPPPPAARPAPPRPAPPRPAPPRPRQPPPEPPPSVPNIEPAMGDDGSDEETRVIDSTALLAEMAAEGQAAADAQETAPAQVQASELLDDDPDSEDEATLMVSEDELVVAESDPVALPLLIDDDEDDEASARLTPSPSAEIAAEAAEMLDDDDDAEFDTIAQASPFDDAVIAANEPPEEANEADIEEVDEPEAEAAPDSEPDLATILQSPDEPEAVEEAAIEEIEEDAPPAAVRPPPPRRAPERVARVTFEDERDASARLVATQQRDGWAARAEWLRGEAESIEDPAAKSRALLVISELLTMAGEDPAARAAAEEALALAPSSPLAHRQVRGLIAREADWPGVLAALDAETRVAETPEARAHGFCFGAEIARLRTADPEGARRRLEQAGRANAADPRGPIQRFCEGLADLGGEGAAWSKTRLPDEESLAPLAAAFAQVAAHRGVETRSDAEAKTSYETLLRARAALAGGDIDAAIDHLSAMRAAEPLTGGAGWLGASLAAARRETRPKAVAALRDVLGGTHGSAARRALAARAIELGDAQAARSATDTSDTEAFSAADRVTLAALSGGSLTETAPWIDAILYDEELAPISVAGRAAMREVATDEDDARAAVGSMRGRASSDLGRTLARVASAPSTSSHASDLRGDLVRTVAAYAAASPDAPVARALSLELDAESGAGGKVARALSSMRAGELNGDRDAALAGALVAEIAGEAERARDDFARARAADPSYQGAARAQASHESAIEAARILGDHGASVGEGERAAVLLGEAAHRLLAEGLADEAEPLLRRAAELAPGVALPLHLGERMARDSGDNEALIEWLRTRREASEDPIEQAHDLVREAQLLAETEPAAAAALLEQALRARPSDLALREMYERLSPEPLTDRAEWRVARVAESPTGVDAARLATEAALELERAGDFERAAELAQLAERAGETELAPLCAYRAALAGYGTGAIVDALLPKVRSSEDPVERLEIYERLAELDEKGRKDAASALLWRRSILEDMPGHLPTLHRVASTLTSAGRDDEMEPIALEIARALDGPEAVAHAALSARLRLRATGWDDTLEPVMLAYRIEPRNVWTLRQTAAHARAQGDHALAVKVDLELAARSDRASEVATLSLRAAEAALRGGDEDAAHALLSRAAELVPDHLPAQLALAALLEKRGEALGAARAYEAAANASVDPAEQTRDFHRAAILWAEKVEDPASARSAFERASAIDPSYADVFERLQAIYVAEGARGELAELLRRRLEVVTDPAERVEMEVLRGRALAEVGDRLLAKDALAAALEGNPDHVEALSAYAELCAGDEDWVGAEGAWIRLARLVSDPTRQAAIYFRLGEVYDTHVPNPERAELAYQEILKRSPGDVPARERLIRLYKNAGDLGRALSEQAILINAAEAPEAKCARTIELAEIYEQTGDPKKAESTLQAARKSWPRDVGALSALASFYQRTDQGPAAHVLLDRAVSDARRALSTGRFEASLFETVATVADLRGKSDASRTAKASVAALEGTPVDMPGAGIAAADHKLDELTAPDVMSPAFRDLLHKTGAALDAVVPFDLSAIRATPLPPQQSQVGDSIRQIAAAYRLPGIQIHVTAALGPVCIPATSNPPTIVLGQSLVASDRDDVRTFLVHRALKILSENCAPLSRTAPIDLWPLLAAYLKALSPSWTPHGVDPGKLTEYYGRVTRAMPAQSDPQLGLLAAEVIGTIGNRASSLNTVVNGWGERVGLLAVGDPNTALTGIAWAGGNPNAPPAAGKERLIWIGRNAGARDLIVYSVSDAYAEARGMLGIG